MARIAIVTGGTRGIGKAISCALKRAGLTVIANYVSNDERAQSFTEETGIPARKWDVADFDASSAAVNAIMAEFGPVDVLVNNAGITRDATMRKMALVQVYYVQRRGNPSSELDSILRENNIREFEVPGRRIDVRKVDDGQILAQVWGVRKLLVPGPAPISAGRWDYGQLEWPGHPDPVTYDQAMHLRPWDVVYVRDNVLARYEGQSGYTVYPDSGAVSFGKQWGVSFAKRVGRDLIELELKKLYEGSRPNTVRHWHHHLVPPPSDAVRAVTQNVGMRAERITYALVTLGEALEAGRAWIAEKL
ncbi:MAG: SDR family NAD(P)-dependent oxidoreductase [Planctomycetes bacterium]|nr:SDR family NAD(P)-dependent oxidoreductase [Planctomycetota bacterium]